MIAVYQQLRPPASERQLAAHNNTLQELLVPLRREYYASHAPVLQTVRTGMHIQRSVYFDLPGLFGVRTINALHACNE